MSPFPEHQIEPPDNDCPSCDELSSRIEELEAENHRLREALETYGQHQVTCRRMLNIGNWKMLEICGAACSCGWTATEKELI